MEQEMSVMFAPPVVAVPAQVPPELVCDHDLTQSTPSWQVVRSWKLCRIF